MNSKWIFICHASSVWRMRKATSFCGVSDWGRRVSPSVQASPARINAPHKKTAAPENRRFLMARIVVLPLPLSGYQDLHGVRQPFYAVRSRDQKSAAFIPTSDVCAGKRDKGHLRRDQGCSEFRAPECVCSGRVRRQQPVRPPKKHRRTKLPYPRYYEFSLPTPLIDNFVCQQSCNSHANRVNAGSKADDSG